MSILGTVAFALILLSGLALIRAMRAQENQRGVYSPVPRECVHPLDEKNKYRYLDAAIARQNERRKAGITGEQ